MGTKNKSLLQARQKQILKIRVKIKENKTENNWIQTENIGH
jgi:hypothetical protein